MISGLYACNPHAGSIAAPMFPEAVRLHARLLTGRAIVGAWSLTQHAAGLFLFLFQGEVDHTP